MKFLFLLLVLGVHCLAAEKDGHSFPDQIKVNGKTLILNGIGLREATIFKVDVYFAGLYLEKKSQNEKEIINSTRIKKIHMQFVRNVSKEDQRDAWQTSLKKNCKTNCDSYKPQLDKLNDLMADIREKDTMSYIFYPDKVDVHMNGKMLGVITGESFPGVLLSMWIGVPPNEGLKYGMLGKSN